jgi:AcrR family transcriptional regulator
MTAGLAKLDKGADLQAAGEPAPRRSRGRPRKESRLDEVLSCAAALFSSRGYVTTTLDDIAAQLGMTRPGIYYYVKSKEELLDQCYAWSLARFYDRLEQEMGDGSGKELLTRFFLVYSEMVCDDASRCFLSTESHHLSPDRQAASAERVHAVNDIVADLLKRGAADGSLSPCDRKFAIATLFGAFNSLPNLVRAGGPAPREMGAKVLNLLLIGLVPREGATPPPLPGPVERSESSITNNAKHSRRSSRPLAKGCP